MSIPHSAELDRAGLNLQAVFNLDELPAAMAAALRQGFDGDVRHRQLILVGHGGRALWAAVKAAGIASPDPIDHFTIRTVAQWFGRHFPGHRHTLVYPGDYPVGLQALGKLAGWHHPSPFMVGINDCWGTWFAYRAALLADTDLEPTPPLAGKSPCLDCREQACIGSCPGGALAGGSFSLGRCVAYRRQPASACRTTCLARLGCPVGVEHRYEDEQIRHTYSISLRAIEHHY